MPASVNTILAEVSDANALLDRLHKDDLAERLYRAIRRRLPLGVQKMVNRGQVALGAIYDNRPAAYVVTLGHLSFAVVLHSGLVHFLYRVIRALCTRVTVVRSGQPDPAATVDLHETARIIAEIYWWYEATGQVYGPSYPILPYQRDFACLLSSAAEQFYLAHEFGHIVLLEGREGQKTKVRNEDLLLSPDQQAQSSAHDDEFLADRFALATVLGMFCRKQSDRPRDLEMAYAGAEVAFQVYRGLEALGVKFEDTHPPAKERLAAIRAAIHEIDVSEELKQRLTQLSNQFEDVFERVLELIRNPADHEAFYLAAATEVSSKLESLLGECCKGPIPAYHHFLERVPMILNSGYSHVLLERIADIASQFYRDMETFRDDPDAEFCTDIMERQNKYKLLLSCVTRMPEPARSVFTNALGIPPGALPIPAALDSE